MPIAAPAGPPRDRLIMKYAPPAPTVRFVAMLDTDRPVMTEMKWASTTISRAPAKPALPTTQPNRRYITTSRIVRMLGVKTPPKAPKRFAPLFLGAVFLVMEEISRPAAAAWR
jgi:hypothetical protein